MIIQHCPRCGKESLAPTGAYWKCTVCRMAITSQAWARDTRHQTVSRPLTQSK
ncbi:hypothetical protein [Candidatus Nitrospira salsa]